MSWPLGLYLRELRERRGISLDEISRVTRVARSYLEALETGEVSKLPAPVFTRGFIRAYCQVLGEPADEALARYGEGPPVPAEEPHEAPIRRARATSPIRAARAPRATRGPLVVSFVLLLVFGGALVAVTLALRSGRDTVDRPPEVARSAPASATPASSVPPASVAPVQGPAPAVASSANEASVPGSANTVVPLGSAPPSAPTAPTTPDPRAAPAPDTSALAAPASRPAGTTPTQPGAGSSAPAAAKPPGAPTDTRTPARTPAASGAIEARMAETASTPPATATAEPDPIREARRIAASAIAPFRLTAKTTQRTWIRVRTEDGKELSDENIPAGQVREWVSNRRLSVSIGNAGGVRLELNGHALPALGPSGAVVQRLMLPPESP